MKNYEVKYATKDTAGLELTKLTNKRVAYLVPNMFGKMKSGFAKKVNPMVIAYQEELARQNAEQEAPVVTEPVNEPVNAETQTSQNVVASTPVIEQPVEDEKKYIIRAKIADFDLLRNNQIKVSTLPKKLLIPTKFKTSLFNNYIKNKEIVVVETEAQKEAELSPAEKQQQAVLEYIALNNQMKDLIKDIEEIKGKMISLAKEHGLTRSMVENAMQN